jgi:hypothetical protein
MLFLCLAPRGLRAGSALFTSHRAQGFEQPGMDGAVSRAAPARPRGARFDARRREWKYWHPGIKTSRHFPRLGSRLRGWEDVEHAPQFPVTLTWARSLPSFICVDFLTNDHWSRLPILVGAHHTRKAFRVANRREHGDRMPLHQPSGVAVYGDILDRGRNCLPFHHQKVKRQRSERAGRPIAGRSIDSPSSPIAPAPRVGGASAMTATLLASSSRCSSI